MLVLRPIVHETVWGGEKLAPYSGSNSRKIGHLYSVYDSGDISNEILNGTWKGRTIGAYFAAKKKNLHLEEFDRFPLVIALVEAADHLSIQVHPDDGVAKRLEGMLRGKNESWYFLEAPQTGKIFNGSKCRDREELERAIRNKELEKTVDYLSVKKDDYVYVTGGTLHALSAGSLVYEIEENMEITYRLYDFERTGADGMPRPLQLEKALAAVHPRDRSVIRHYGAEPIEERLYVTQKYTGLRRYKNVSNTVECVTLLSGESYLPQAGQMIRMGQSVILEPGEELHMAIESAIVARPKRTNIEGII